MEIRMKIFLLFTFFFPISNYDSSMLYNKKKNKREMNNHTYIHNYLEIENENVFMCLEQKISPSVSMLKRNIFTFMSFPTTNHSYRTVSIQS